ncbi:MAG: NADH-quinone oxidoreductase subunit J [Chloroflexi bacterium]|nr:NADH-quinone oxidoreductase subunit J [Chloroflexota bacterium]
MIAGPLVDATFWVFALGSIVAGYRVFRTDSMVRAAFYLLASFAGVGGIVVLLGAEFLGMVLILMMAGEMLIMAIVMVMFMMNPAGLNPMVMVHQNRRAAVAGIVAFVALAAVGLLGNFPARPVPDPSTATAELGTELLGDSMLVFQSAGVALLSTMIGAVVIAGRKGRFGVAEEDSIEPSLQPDEEPGR